MFGSLVAWFGQRLVLALSSEVARRIAAAVAKKIAADIQAAAADGLTAKEVADLIRANFLSAEGLKTLIAVIENEFLQSRSVAQRAETPAIIPGA